MKLVAGNKYGGVREQAVRTSGRAGADGAKRQRTAALQNLAEGRKGPAIFVPTLLGARDSLRDWYWRELKEGGFLQRYLEGEKRKTPARLRTIARFMEGFKQNSKSDFRLVASVPGRVYQRWKAEDKDFFADDGNLRSLRRDNPEACVYL